MNKIIIIGRLVRDPDFKTTTGGKEIANFTVAVDRKIKSQDAGAKNSDFFPTTAFGATAKFVSNYLTKGRLVAVEGRIESRKYEKDGVTREVWEIKADSVQGLDKPQEGSQPRAATTASTTPVASADLFEDEDPFAE